MNTIADALWLARLRGSTVAVPEGLSLAQAYAVAEHNHARRLADDVALRDSLKSRVDDLGVLLDGLTITALPVDSAANRPG